MVTETGMEIKPKEGSQHANFKDLILNNLKKKNLCDFFPPLKARKMSIISLKNMNLTTTARKLL